MLKTYGGVLFYLSFLLLCQCVGPTTPFGVPSDRSIESHSIHSEQKLKVQFTPERLLYHDKTDFSVEIEAETELPDGMSLKLFHNGNDVTESFINQGYVHKSTDKKRLLYSMKDLRLKILDANKIEVKIIVDNKIIKSVEYGHPECSLFQGRQIASLKPFKTPGRYIKLINKVSHKNQSNPNFLAGMVAQESGFNPQAVSWAKAIGLTQMTPLAEQQVYEEIKNWPRYPGINKLSYLTLRSKILLGEITETKEWRLNPELSLNGGMAYINYLKKYWKTSKNQDLIKTLDGDPQLLESELILASYNSGAARVRRAVLEKKNNWKNHSKLTEAAKYIRKVSSYCYHNSEKELEDDS